MQIPPEHLYKALRNARVDHIYHANTVVTSSHFLRAGALLSRGEVEQRGLRQTPQSSDAIDKKHGIWFDVFADSVDIHERASTPNLYGPVLFVLDLKIITDSFPRVVSVTRLNPTKWDGLSEDAKWFTSAEHLEKEFRYGEFDQMIVFRECGGEVSFEAHLKEVVIDDPGQNCNGGIDYYAHAVEALTMAMNAGGITTKVRKRRCSMWCKCKAAYRADTDWTKRAFLAQV